MILTFPGYGVNSTPFTVIVEKINHWYRVEYNGRSGTKIVMDNGAELTTEKMPYEVQKAIEDMKLIEGMVRQ